MRRACTVALAMMVMATSLPAMAGTLEACRAAQPEARDVVRCVQAARKAAQAELATAESARRSALRRADSAVASSACAALRAACTQRTTSRASGWAARQASSVPAIAGKDVAITIIANATVHARRIRRVP